MWLLGFDAARQSLAPPSAVIPPLRLFLVFDGRTGPGDVRGFWPSTRLFNWWCIYRYL
jgi:hypothetical protein